MPDKVIRALDKYLVRPIHYEGLLRVEPLEIPEGALREAIYNAIIHKDYTGAHIQMKVWDDRVELCNERQFKIRWTVENLQQPHSSKPRNPNLAKIFYMAGFIEHWGRGIDKIVKQTTDADLKAPQFKDFLNGLQVTFRRNVALRGEGIVQDNVQDNVHENQPKPCQKSAVKSAVKPAVKSAVKILILIRENPFITRNEISNAINLSIRAVDNNIEKLKKEGRILRVGPDKGGHWEIVD